MPDFGLYIHIPFCKKKCNYCDFVSYAGKEDLMDEYVDRLIAEIKALTPFFFLPLNKGENVERSETRGGISTIYIGGGTPTLLESRHVEKILNALESRQPNAENRTQELTIEANPGTANESKLKELRKFGINRLSIGVQSFDDRHLKTLGRIHTATEAIKFYNDARAAGFENINLDLIFALPGQTLADWKKDLSKALNLKPNHLSTYNLQIEEETPFHKNPNIKIQIPNEEEELAMYEYAIETLSAAGYNHYEISNFAKPGFECLHNINYWKNGNYLGIGAGAHSHINGKRWANCDSIEEYLKTPSSFLPLIKGENVERSETRGGETLFMGLRLLEGLPERQFQGFEKELAELMESGLLAQDNSHIKLTRQGLYLANEVFEKFV